MKHILMQEIVNIDGELLCIQANPAKEQGCYKEILEAIYFQLTNMLSHHSKLLVIRLDFHVNELTEKNTLMSDFIQKLRKAIKKEYPKHTRFGFVWAREKERAKQQHYHVALMLNGNIIQYPSKFISLCESIWEGMNQPKPYTPEHAFYTVKRDDSMAFSDAFYRVSYLAKVRGKKYRAKTTNDYSTSRIKKKECSEGNINCAS